MSPPKYYMYYEMDEVLFNQITEKTKNIQNPKQNAYMHVEYLVLKNNHKLKNQILKEKIQIKFDILIS